MLRQTGLDLVEHLSTLILQNNMIPVKSYSAVFYHEIQ